MVRRWIRAKPPDEGDLVFQEWIANHSRLPWAYSITQIEAAIAIADEIDNHAPTDYAGYKLE